MKWDGHTHTRFCYHGSSAEQELYLDRAVEQGFDRYTISEHPPLPEGWIVDPVLFEELAMPMEELPEYIAFAKEMKKRYDGKLEVTVGLEIDHLPGNYSFTEQILDQWGHELEDVVYSVHYLNGVGGMRCIDYTPDDFKVNLLEYYGSMEKVVDSYYDQVEEAIGRAAKLPMRKRIGHINLIEKFRLVLPQIEEDQIKQRLERIVPLLVQSKVGLDINTAGLRVGTCGKPYVPEWFLAECLNQGVDCVYGSDSHKPEHVGHGWDWYAEQIAKNR